MISEPIADSIWLTGGTLLVGTGNQMLQYGQLRHSALSSQELKETRPGLFEAVARLNGPLLQYHPQMILQCLLWGKVELVKRIIIQLAKALDKVGAASDNVELEWEELPVEMFLMKEQSPMSVSAFRRIQAVTIVCKLISPFTFSGKVEGLAVCIIKRCLMSLTSLSASRHHLVSSLPGVR
jgi:hypothetical protein